MGQPLDGTTFCPVLSESPTGTPAPACHVSRDTGLLPAAPAVLVPGAARLTFLACDVIQSCAIFNLWLGHSAPLPVNTAQMTVLESCGGSGLCTWPSHQGPLSLSLALPEQSKEGWNARRRDLHLFVCHSLNTWVLRTRQRLRQTLTGLKGLRKALNR